MSDIKSAFPDARFDALVTVEEAGPRGMITLRGDLSKASMAKAVKAAAGTEMPGQGAVILAGDKGAAWMAPDEVLVLCPYHEATDTAAKAQKAMGKTHHLVANVSDARAAFVVQGPAAREVLGKLTPADLHPDRFGPGQIRRTRLAQVPAAFWMRDDMTFEVICFRSVAEYMFDLLCNAARNGTTVDHY